MQHRRLGPFSVSALGLGCMNLSHAYGTPPTPEAAAALLLRALNDGIDFFDTAALYGFGANETLVGEVLKPHPDRIVLASKGGMAGVNGKRVIDGRPEAIKRDCEDSLRRLQTDVVDLYYLEITRKIGCTPAQLALAWLLAQGEDIIPIFGTSRPEHLDDNAGAAAVSLDRSILEQLDALFNQQTVTGPRYNDATQAEIDTEIFSN